MWVQTDSEFDTIDMMAMTEFNFGEFMAGRFYTTYAFQLFLILKF